MKWLAAIALSAALFAGAQDKQQGRDPDGKRTRTETSMTGCLDQHGETYVLAGSDAMGKQASLRGRA
jgi:hypothetical protein